MNDRQVPAVDRVLEVLSSHGVQTRSHLISGNYKHVEDEVQSFLQNQNAPVVIIHYENTVVQRSLASINTSSVPTLTEFQISQYQVSSVIGCLI